MAPIDNIRCLACKKKGGKLEDWSYEPEALGPEDIGECSTPIPACFAGSSVLPTLWLDGMQRSGLHTMGCATQVMIDEVMPCT